MKTRLFSAVFLLGISTLFCSCEKETMGTDRSIIKTLIGCWVMTEHGGIIDNSELVAVNKYDFTFYTFEFTEDGYIREKRYVAYLTYNNGVLHASCSDSRDDSVWKYKITDGVLRAEFVPDPHSSYGITWMDGRKITIINDDTLLLIRSEKFGESEYGDYYKICRVHTFTTDD